MTPMTSERLAEIKEWYSRVVPDRDDLWMIKTAAELIAEVERLTAELATWREDGERLRFVADNFNNWQDVIFAVEEVERWPVSFGDTLRAAIDAARKANA